MDISTQLFNTYYPMRVNLEPIKPTANCDPAHIIQFLETMFEGYWSYEIVSETQFHPKTEEVYDDDICGLITVRLYTPGRMYTGRYAYNYIEMPNAHLYALYDALKPSVVGDDDLSPAKGKGNPPLKGAKKEQKPEEDKDVVSFDITSNVEPDLLKMAAGQSPSPVPVQTPQATEQAGQAAPAPIQEEQPQAEPVKKKFDPNKIYTSFAEIEDLDVEYIPFYNLSDECLKELMAFQIDTKGLLEKDTLDPFEFLLKVDRAALNQAKRLPYPSIDQRYLEEHFPFDFDAMKDIDDKKMTEEEGNALRDRLVNSLEAHRAVWKENHFKFFDEHEHLINYEWAAYQVLENAGRIATRIHLREAKKREKELEAQQAYQQAASNSYAKIKRPWPAKDRELKKLADIVCTDKDDVNALEKDPRLKLYIDREKTKQLEPLPEAPQEDGVKVCNCVETTTIIYYGGVPALIEAKELGWKFAPFNIANYYRLYAAGCIPLSCEIPYSYLEECLREAGIFCYEKHGREKQRVEYLAGLGYKGELLNKKISSDVYNDYLDWEELQGRPTEGPALKPRWDVELPPPTITTDKGTVMPAIVNVEPGEQDPKVIKVNGKQVTELEALQLQADFRQWHVANDMRYYEPPKNKQPFSPAGTNQQGIPVNQWGYTEIQMDRMQSIKENLEIVNDEIFNAYCNSWRAGFTKAHISPSNIDEFLNWAEALKLGKLLG